MENFLEMQQVIYNVVKTQIQFGAYQFEERLPTIEDAALIFQVSVKTIRSVYQRLAREGYITVTKSIGVKVNVQYSKQDTEAYIQQFFTERKNALLDLSQSMPLLFSNAQWLGFKNTSWDVLQKMEQFASPKESLRPYIMIQQLQIVYGSLGNDQLMRLVWQTFMFLLTPFLSVSGNFKSLWTGHNPLLEMIDLCLRQNWTALRKSVEEFQEQKYYALHGFYEERILLPPAKQQPAFTWSSYKKTSQICYSLGMELLTAIIDGVYPPNSFLPSLNVLAKEKKVSVNTVRRTLSLLNNIGATKSINGVGTQILPLDQGTQNCDLSQTIVRERLLDFTKSLHILYLSCRHTSEATISVLDEAAIENWKEQIKACQRKELLAYVILKLICKDAPYMAVRTVYTELFQQLFWGHSLRSMERNPSKFASYYLPYFDVFLDCLNRRDAARFAVKLEALMKHEIEFAISQLDELGIDAVAPLVL